MMTSDDKVGGWVKKGQNHDDVILECPLSKHIGPLKRYYALVPHMYATPSHTIFSDTPF